MSIIRPTKPYTFVAGAVGKAAEVNSDFDTLYSKMGEVIDQVNNLDGSTVKFVSNYDSLTAAVAAIGSTVTELIVDINTNVTANLTIPATLNIVVIRTGSITHGAYTITFDGLFTAGWHTVFSGTGRIYNLMAVKAEWFGAVGDGSTDDIIALNKALTTLSYVTASTKPAGFQLFYASFMVPRKLLLKEGSRYAISSPMLAEENMSASPYTYFDNLVIEGYSSQIVVLAGFTGVSRAYNTIGGTETIKAALIIGPKEFGKYSSPFQVANKVLGVQFIGNGDSDLAAIYVEAGDGYIINDVYCENMGYGVKTRVFKFGAINNIKGVDVLSLVYSYNNSNAIKIADPASMWASGGTEGGGFHINGFFNICDSTKLVESRKDDGVLHLYNTSEMKVDNVIIFGGSRGVVLEGTSYTIVGAKWDEISNVEITQTELAPLFIKWRRYLKMNNIQLTWGYYNTHSWASGVYTNAHMMLEHVTNSMFHQVIIDRDTFVSEYQGGHNLNLDSCASNRFAGIQFIGRPGPVASDDLYAHINLVSSGYNVFRDVDATQIDNSVSSWKYGFNIDAGSAYNLIDGSHIRSLKNPGFEYVDNADFNIKRNLRYDSSGRPYVSDGTLTGTLGGTETTYSVDFYEQLNFAQSGATNFTQFTDTLGTYVPKNIVCIFFNANTTLVNSGNLLLKGGINVNVPANGVMQFQVVNGVSREMSRNF